MLAAIAITIVAASLMAIPAAADGPVIALRAVQPPRAALQRLSRPATATAPLTPPTAPSPVKRIMVVGDSVALTLGRGIERWGPSRGIEVLNAARLYCPIARGGKLAASFGHSTGPCDDWPTYWGKLESEFHPDVVLVLTTIWDLSARQRDEWGPDYLNMRDPRFDAFIAQEWAAAVHVLGSSGARVIWLAPACSQDSTATRDYRYSKDHYIRASVAAGATMIRKQAQLKGIALNTTPATVTITYQRTGRTTATAAPIFTLDAYGPATPYRGCIKIELSGMPRIYKPVSGVC